ncbi:hypothetical protein OEZ86_005358 [Tetradesmus obliquus]|nr:hypothetical protein OEZ86_005358 [Tetradesmus obliquus]
MFGMTEGATAPLSHRWGYKRYYSALSLLLVFWGSAALQTVFAPYAAPTLHRMHLVSTSCLAATTMGALAMFAYNVEESTAFALRIAITALVFAINLAFVAWCLIKLAPAFKQWCLRIAATTTTMPWVVGVVQPGRRRPHKFVVPRAGQHSGAGKDPDSSGHGSGV